MFNTSLILSYVLKGYNKRFLGTKPNCTSVIVPTGTLYFLSLHVKLSSLFFSTQLVDLFSYQSLNFKGGLSIATYYFYNNMSNKGLLVFSMFSTKNGLSSISELFLNANWLEREASELSGLLFFFKKDTRNLMMPYGDLSTPFNKNFPTIGYRELFYSNVLDNIISVEVSIQY